MSNNSVSYKNNVSKYIGLVAGPLGAVVPAALALWLAFAPGRAAAASAPGVPRTLQIDDVTVVSPERETPLRHVDVTVFDGRIRDISPHVSRAHPASSAFQELRGQGLYLVPGLIDSHVHLHSIPGMTAEQEAAHPALARAAHDQMPRSFLRYGYTTLIDLISVPEAMAQWKQHEAVPDTYFCGGAALMDGYPMNFMAKPQRYQFMPYMLIEPGTPAPPGIDPSAHTPQAVVARMKADGAICVKTFFERGFDGLSDLPVPSLETVKALVRAAHAAALPVMMHANSAEAQAFGVEAGVDILAHGLWNWHIQSDTTELTPELRKILDGVLAAHMGWQPTIQVLYGERELFDPRFLDDPALARVYPRSLIEWYRTPQAKFFRDAIAKNYQATDPAALEAAVDRDYDRIIQRAEQGTRYLLQHDGRILFGTDTPSAPTYANPPGLNGWWEMQRRAAAGETPAHLFRSATLVNAQAFKLEADLGSVEVGKRGNLLLLEQDPTQTIQAYAHIVEVILDGRVLAPRSLEAPHR
jgi:imidazolonepropionase-like amidohydrolase